VEQAMTDDIFISYSRRDLEFVTRLASDLDALVSGVWFDKSDIRAGERWRDSITNGIRNCKVMILVLSPDAAASKNVRDEINSALEAGKTIIPVLYRATELQGGLADLVHETQYIDLRRGSYSDNFQTLVDGLIAAGALRQDAIAGPRPFLRQPVQTDWGAVVSKVPGWGCAWSIGWMAFFFLIAILLIVFSTASRGSDSVGDLLGGAVSLALGGGIGGFAGGLLAGLVTMLALRRYAPSITWRHMSPAIRNWIISGPLGVLVSGAATATLVAVGAIGMSSATPDCSGLSFSECLGQGIGSAIGQAIGFFIIVLLVFFVILIGIWFATGLLAGWLSVRHIRRLEPGITRREAGWVMFGWGLGSLVGSVAGLAAAGLIGPALG
jgi:TIR domain-containing protein